MVDVEEIRTKQGYLMVNRKRTPPIASSNRILDVVKLGEGNKIVGLNSITVSGFQLRRRNKGQKQRNRQGWHKNGFKKSNFNWKEVESSEVL